MLLSIVYALVRLLLDIVTVRLRSDAATRLELVVLRSVCSADERSERPGAFRIVSCLPR